MALSFVNRCIWRATSSGSGDFVVASAITGYVVPQSTQNPSVTSGDDYTYFAQSDDLTQWEVGVGAYDVGTDTLARTTILDSSTGGSIVTFSAAPSVYMGGPLVGYMPTPSGVVTNPMTANLDVDGYEITGNASNRGITLQGYNNTGGSGGLLELYSGDGDGTFEAGGDFYAYAGTNTSSGGFGGNMEFGAGTGDTAGSVVFYGGSGLAGKGGSVSFVPAGGSTDGGDLNINLPAAGSGRQGLVIITGLPTSDPGVSGALWVDGSNFLKVSP